MHWRLSDASAIGVVGSSQIEVSPGSPALGARWQISGSQAVQPGVAWQIASVRPQPAHSSQPQEVYSRQSDLIVRYGQGPSEQFSYQLDWRLLEPPAPFAAAIELWLSVQTDLLDTQPELEIACTAPAGALWQVFEHQRLATNDHSSASGLPGGAPANESQSTAAIPAPSQATNTDPSQATDAAWGPAALLCSGSSTDANLATVQAGCVRGGCVQGLWLIEPTDQRHARRCSDDDQAEQRVRLFGHFMEKGVIRRARMRFLLADLSHAQATITEQQVIAAYRDFANSPLPLTA